MNRKGILAFIIYLLATLGGGGLALWSFIELKIIESSESGDWSAIGAAIILALGLIILVPYAVCLIAKIIQMASGAKFFGVLCIIFDVVIIGALAYTFFVENNGDNLIAQILALIPSTLALISNALSLKD